MWYLKIWLTVIVVLVIFTSINTSQKLDLKRHANARLKYSCKHSNMCKNGGTCIPYRRHGWFRRCICPEGWTGRRCKVPLPKYVCKNRKFCKNGGTPVFSGRFRRSCRCICTNGWTGRRCGDNSEVIDKQNDENRDFISVILSDHQMQYTPSYIFMTTHTSTNVNITTSEALPEDHITKFNSSVTIPYTDFGTNGSSDVKAIRISSTENITAALGVQDITTLITTEKLGTSYILPNPYKDPRFEAYAAITVTAIHDNTTITISDWGETTFPNYTLNALETHVQEHHGSLPKTYSIQSSKPVAVFSGMYCMSDANCSNIIEQIPPFNQLDTVYIIPPNYNRFLTYILYLSKDNTTITSMNNDTIPITGGKRYDYIMLNEVVTVIRSADPILMTSYAVQYLPLGEHNPYWTVVPGVNQYLPRYKTVIQSGWNNNYIAIMIRKSAVGGMRLNKQSIDANTIRFEKNVFVEDLEYSVIIAEVAEGELTLDTIDGTPFGLMVYGSGEHGGYGFAGNVILR